MGIEKGRFKSEEARRKAERKAYTLWVSGESLLIIKDKLEIGEYELESRLLGYINREEDECKKQELFEIMFLMKGFPRQDILKRYSIGNLSLKEFKKVNKISDEYFESCLSAYEHSAVIQKKLAEKEERLNRVPVNKGRVYSKTLNYYTSKVTKKATYY